MQKHFEVTETSPGDHLNQLLENGSNTALVSLTRAGRPHNLSDHARRSS